MTDDQRAAQRADWKAALAANARQNRGGRGRRYRAKRTGLAAVDGPGRVQIPAPQPAPTDVPAPGGATTKGMHDGNAR